MYGNASKSHFFHSQQKHTMKFTSHFRHLIGIAQLLAFAPGIHAAQPYPDRPIRLVVPFAPGGIFDYIARLVSPKLSELLGQNVIVDNRAGGGGVIAMQLASASTPDGYTILLADPSLVINTYLHQPSPYDLKELAPITILTAASLVLAINAKVPAHSVKELVTLAKTSNLNYGSAGIGTTPHMAAELFKARSQAQLLHVPFKGVGPAVTAVLGGQVQLVFGSLAGTEAYIKDGRLRGLATTGDKRAKAMPDLPTLKEAGYPDSDVLVWGGLFVRAGTPQFIINRLNSAARKALSDSGVRGSLDKVAIEPLGTSPEEAAAFVRRDYEKWGRLIHSAGIKAD